MPHVWLQPQVDPEIKIDLFELAWAAGFFDGEGSTTANRTRRRSIPRPRVQVTQVDRRNLERLQSAVRGVGRIRGPVLGRRGQPQFVFYTTRWTETQFAVALLWRWLGPGKRAQAVRALSEYLTADRAYRASFLVCRLGHPKPRPGACPRCHIQTHLRWRARNRARWDAYMHEYGKRQTAQRQAARVSAATTRSGEILQHPT